MKKGLIFLLLFIIAPLIGGLYGILHDQLTYTISPEYYTKFKFYQFGLAEQGDEAIFPDPRLEVSIVGFLATWWMGVPIGVILGGVGMVHETARKMFRFTMQAMLVTIIVAFVTGLIGLVYGWFFLPDTPADWWLPDNLIHKRNFVAVGSMHNFSYIGGAIGLIAGIVYSVRKKDREA